MTTLVLYSAVRMEPDIYLPEYQIEPYLTSPKSILSARRILPLENKWYLELILLFYNIWMNHKTKIHQLLKYILLMSESNSTTHKTLSLS